MSKLAYPIILGKPWMEKNGVVYLAKRQCLRIGSRKHGIIVRASGWYENKAPATIKSRVSQVSRINAVVTSRHTFAKLCKHIDPLSGVILGALSVHDITRALENKEGVV